MILEQEPETKPLSIPEKGKLKTPVPVVEHFTDEEEEARAQWLLFEAWRVGIL